MKRLRLLKVAVQPTFVIDDGEELVEHVGPLALVGGGHWRAFAEKSFSDEDLATIMAQIDPPTVDLSDLEAVEVTTD